MLWLHEKCVGISEDYQIGLWFCPACRSIPTALNLEINTFINDVQQLKECIQSILTTVNGLSEKVDNNIECLNARLTSLNRSISTKDLSMSESLESLSSRANRLKTTVGKTSCNIINKTTATFDTVKSQTENAKSIAEK